MKYTRQARAVGKRHCRLLYLRYVPHLPKKCCINSGNTGMMGSGEWGIIDLDFIIPMQPETIGKSWC
jgi:hypothetical protein